MLQDIFVTGLVNGGVYALLAIGFSLIFGVARIVNIAHTAFYMLAAYCFYTLLTKTGLGFVLSGVVAVAAVTLLSVVCYRLVIEPVREHEAAVLIATIALALIFQEVMLYTFGGHFLGIPSTLEGAVRFLGVTIPYQRLLILVVAAAMLIIVWFVLYRTRLGLAIRATANDLEVANLMGMNVHRVAMATVAISVALAAVAGVVVAPIFVVDPFMWLAPLVTMLAIVVLGGLGSLKGSLIGALIIGYVEAITVFAVPAGAYLKGAVALMIMVAVLLARPEGLFGVAFEEER
ncbi:MAG TPA: branched-chain amino acid ABC transporter permease [Burkholderiales bacterium]|nr:branched-chain amino acid ABC transporter permease [Burkholderiales bacterium]HEU0260162.1 branched-chain amino acid ABC transporter permease [Burkholderiales bacterium]HSA68901.1 branched-chain amino acid ABC transporter permease [Burkholderiales bacterium]